MSQPAGAAAARPLWAAIRGQDAAVALLRRALATDRVAHAYAFVGPPGVGRRLTALAFARACLCPRQGCGACAVCRRVAAGQHPDCQLIVPTPPKDNPKGPLAIRMEQVRDLEHWAALAPLEAPRKLFIVDDADRLTREAPQALLKTLEEPPPRTLLILIVANVRGLPPTVLSRCQLVRFRPLPELDAVALLVERGADAAAAGRLARLCRGQVGLALAADLEAVQAHRAAALELLATAPPRLAGRLDEARLDRDRDTVAALLETFWLWYRDALCLAAGGDATPLVNEDRREDLTALAGRLPVPALTEALRVVKEAWLALETNVNPRLALERALLALAPRAA
jgi:DNA polymerase III subunit delta'